VIALLYLLAVAWGSRELLQARKRKLTRASLVRVTDLDTGRRLRVECLN
jgi:hypothetical protein